MTRIAIVEDEAAVREQLAGYVQRYTRQYGTPFEVTEFADGMEILEDYRPQFDIIFLDVEMKHLDGGMRRLDAAEIYYLESEGHKVHFYTEKEDFMVPGTLKNYEEKLVGRAFARCNSGYLVNLAQVSGVQQDMVQVGPYALQISRPRRKAFMAGLADYIGGAGQ